MERILQMMAASLLDLITCQRNESVGLNKSLQFQICPQTRPSLTESAHQTSSMPLNIFSTLKIRPRAVYLFFQLECFLF